MRTTNPRHDEVFSRMKGLERRLQKRELARFLDEKTREPSAHIAKWLPRRDVTALLRSKGASLIHASERSVSAWIARYISRRVQRVDRKERQQ